MTDKTPRRRQTTVRSAAWAIVAALILLCLPAQADDRALLRETVGAPYLFIIFDTSGSMHWSPKCTAENYNLPADDPAKCNHLCPTGDCFVQRNGDDPNSKFRQAKEALYEVIGQVDNVHFGFASYNQNNLRVKSKHWIYRVSEDQPNGYPAAVLSDGTPFPFAGWEDNFGPHWPCSSGGDNGTGCSSRGPWADIEDPWEMARVARYPKLTPLSDSYQYLYFRDLNRTRYRILYRPLSQATPWGQNLGDPILDVKIKLQRCNPSYADCGNWRRNETIFDHEIRFERVADFLAWDNGANRTDPQMGFFGQGDSSDQTAGATCDGWDPNTDSHVDDYNGYSVCQLTDDSDPRVAQFGDDGWRFSEGDVIPLDWNGDNKDKLLRRFAPSQIGDPTGDPDFGVASYFQDERLSGQSYLRLKDEAERPMISTGATPLGESIKDFRIWYAGCAHGACPNDMGWSDFGAMYDPDWACRKKYLLVVTDGDETCRGADACSGTAALLAQEDVKTYVVAFGVENTSGNRLNCMANNGGTDEPIYPQNKQELVDALTKIFGEIKEEARAFASAAVPSVESTVADQIYMSSFIPINGVPFWDGHLDAFLKPLPLTEDGMPDRDRECSASITSGCHLFDAGEMLLQQAPTADQAEGDTFADLKLGDRYNQRRVLYGKENLFKQVPGTLRVFGFADPEPPFGDPDVEDLMWGMNITPPTDEVDWVNRREEVQTVIRNTLAIKTATLEDLDGNVTEISYILGDIFHSDPAIIDSPKNFGFYVQDLFGDDALACDDAQNPNLGYRCFAERHRWRRKMLAVGANDGQLHFFEAGFFKKDLSKSDDPYDWRYTLGTGLELFSYIPRLVLPALREQALGTRQVYTVDGSLKVDDVFIDPSHDGTPDPEHREWRTVGIGGLREGGSIDSSGHLDASDGFRSGYYAIDITQPDGYSEYTYQRNTNVGTEVTEIHYLPSEGTVPGCLRVRWSDGEHLSYFYCATAHGDPREFPAELWIFTDSILAEGIERWFDEEDVDGDGVPEGNTFVPDLGDTWSNPVVTMIQVCTANCDPADPDNDIERRFVAVVGGGLDWEQKSNPYPQHAAWIYMIDVETGRALYKRQVEGSVAAAPAVISDQFGLAEMIYFPTTAGLVYKIDMRDGPGVLSERLYDPQLLDPAPTNPVAVTRVFDSAWEPFPIFDTTDPATGLTRPIYNTITAFRVDEIDSYVLAFGSGDREDLWFFDGVEGRYYFILDENFTLQMHEDGDLPVDETSYQTIYPDLANFGLQGDDVDFVLEPDRQHDKRGGWVMHLGADERSMGQAFGIKGILIFTTYQPQAIAIGDDHGNPHDDEGVVCARTGHARIFAIFADNGNPLELDGERYSVITGFLGPTVVDPGSTTNIGNPDDTGADASQLTEEDRIKMEALKKFFPEECRFANYWLNVTGSRSDTGVVIYIKVPICSIEGRWRDI